MVKIYKANKLYATLTTFDDAALIVRANSGIVAKVNGRTVWSAHESADGSSDQEVAQFMRNRHWDILAAQRAKYEAELAAHLKRLPPINELLGLT